MQVGHDGEVWIAIKTGSIHSYDHKLDQFVKRISFKDPSINIYHFAFLPDERIAIGTNKGVYIARAGEDPKPLALQGNLVHYLLPYGDRIYAGTQKGVYNIGVNDGKTSLIAETETVAEDNGTSMDYAEAQPME